MCRFRCFEDLPTCGEGACVPEEITEGTACVPEVIAEGTACVPEEITEGTACVPEEITEGMVPSQRWANCFTNSLYLLFNAPVLAAGKP